MYRGPHATRVIPPLALRALPWIFAAVTITLQITWAFVESPARETFTTLVVLTFAMSSVLHAIVWRGVVWAFGLCVIVLGVAAGAEILGVNTGVPFGRYQYSDLLAPTLFSMPVIIPFAWLMMAYPAFIIARALTSSWWSVALIGSLALTAWDLFLDPQMIGAGYWSWQEPGLPIAGLNEIPWTNLIGWFAVSLIMMLLLDLLPNQRASSVLPAALYIWSWLGGVVVNLLIFDRPFVALWGGLAMGVFGFAYIARSLLAKDSPIAH
jgi:putative membrane protein